mgnify:CR=1 FL=1
MAANELTELLTGEPKEEISDKVISKDNTPQDDKEIRNRIREIFAELDNLTSVKVAVSKGIVTLTGEIDTADIGKRAAQYARQVEGVVEVENQLTITRNIERRVNTALERLEKTGTHLLNSLPLFLLATLLVVIFWIIGRWVGKRQSFYQRFTPNGDRLFHVNSRGQTRKIVEPQSIFAVDLLGIAGQPCGHFFVRHNRRRANKSGGVQAKIPCHRNDDDTNKSCNF